MIFISIGMIFFDFSFDRIVGKINDTKQADEKNGHEHVNNANLKKKHHHEHLILLSGGNEMMPPIIVLVLSWGLSSIIEYLGFVKFITNTIAPQVPTIAL